MTRSGSKQLMRVLASPSKVANALDWRRTTGGAIATIDIHVDRIGVRISQHPSAPKRGQQRYSLPVSPRGRTRIPESTRQELSDLVHQHKVCGFVVAWPIQEDTGLMGAACGRTLFAIEELLRKDLTTKTTTTTNDDHTTNTMRPVFSPNRPICLWDAGGDREQSIDAFGRSPLYSRTTNKTEHFASREQYHQDESVLVAGIWDDFVRTHWPGMNRETDERLVSSMNIHSCEDEGEQVPPAADTPTIWDGSSGSSSRHRRQTAIRAI